MNTKKKEIDWVVTLAPFFLIVALCVVFVLAPLRSNAVLERIRFVLGDTFGVYYLALGLFVLLMALYLAFSRYGNIVLGERGEKPQHSFFAWGSMMFTAGLAADIVFYSLCEWILYANDPHIAELGSVQDWASTYPLFHWGAIPWSFYLVLAVAFGFMLHVRKRKKQKFSEACRPLLGTRTDGLAGRLIDLLAVFALLAGTATTFSLATPLMTKCITALFGISISEKAITIVILLATCAVYTRSVLSGMQGISLLAKTCTWMFFGLLLYVFVCGGEARYIVETGFSAIGRMAQNFIGLATYTDPARTTSFPQNWTIFYWSYWMVWSVASPFFIGAISRGRTVRQTILGGYFFGLAGTFVSFIVLGNYSLGLQVSGRLDVMAVYAAAQNLYDTILAILETLPFVPFVLALLFFTMIAFYATSFDAIALVGASYSYKQLDGTAAPATWVKLLWSVLLILLPLALIFSESSMSNLQSVSIIAAFPLGIVIILIVVSFLKDAQEYLEKGH